MECLKDKWSHKERIYAKERRLILLSNLYQINELQAKRIHFIITGAGHEVGVHDTGIQTPQIESLIHALSH